jgi:hypothetical protein
VDELNKMFSFIILGYYHACGKLDVTGGPATGRFGTLAGVATPLRRLRASRRPIGPGNAVD